MSPWVLEKVSYVGTLLKSFPMGERAVEKLMEMIIGRKRIERVTERIGGERLEQAEEEVTAFEKLTLMKKVNGPENVTAPKSAAVMLDGGRYQRTEQNPDATSEKSTHWYEYKAGLCLQLEGRRDGAGAGPDAPDPDPEVPEFLLNIASVEKLTREIGKKAAAGESPEEIDHGGLGCAEESTSSDAVPESLEIERDGVKNLEALEGRLSAAAKEQADSPGQDKKRTLLSPKVNSREVVATFQKGHRIGLQLAARSWKLGLFQSTFKAFVGDGSGWIWTIFAKFFKPFGFTPILDIIHAVTYVYAAAMAGRTHKDGAPIYQQWVRWLWQGALSQLIAAVAARQAELGLPAPGESKTSPRQIVSKALTYFQNHQDKMRYPEYRKLGLPITSSHMESTIKELNYRIKGSEKFWSEPGGAAVLQMKADTLGDSDPLADFWGGRQDTRTGLRTNAGHRKHPPKPAVVA